MLYSERPTDTNVEIRGTDPTDLKAIEQLVSLLKEGGEPSDDEEAERSYSWKRDAGLKICSVTMPQFRKNKRLSIFLDLVQEDLERLAWKGNNLSGDERRALKELQEAREVVIKQTE